MSTRILWILLSVSLASTTFVGCDDDDDDTSSEETGTVGGTGGSTAGTSAGGAGGSTAGTGAAGSSAGAGGDEADGGATEEPNNPPGCVSGERTTQEDFINHCTESAAVTVDLDFTPATASDLP